MSYVNIPRSREDPNYRYKMPRIVARIEGRGNGIRTNIANMGDIARSLNRPATYATKFFGCELGTLAKFDEAEEKALINGAHTEAMLSEVLDRFIDKYVLCPDCALPETDLSVKKGSLGFRCNACGKHGLLGLGDKVATFMVKNPPQPSALKKGAAKELKERPDEEPDPKKAKAKKVKSASSKKSEPKDDPDAVAPAETLDYKSPEISDLVTRLRTFLEGQPELDPPAFFMELRILQISQALDGKARIYLALAALLEPDFPYTRLETRGDFIKVACNGCSSEDILDAIEFFIVENAALTLQSYPYVLQHLYRRGLVSGDDMLKHYDRDMALPHFVACQKSAQPFLNWLR